MLQHVMRAYLGVTVQEVTPAIAKAIGLNGPKGALVSDVSPNSPAQKAGLQSGDVILAVNSTPILESNQLRMDISMMETNQSLKLKIFRNGKTQDVSAMTAELPGTKVERASNDNKGDSGALEGVSVQPLDPRTAQQDGLSANASGVVVTVVDPSSAAADSGLKEERWLADTATLGLLLESMASNELISIRNLSPRRTVRYFVLSDTDSATLDMVEASVNPQFPGSRFTGLNFRVADHPLGV